jgi:hypothetical protein
MRHRNCKEAGDPPSPNFEVTGTPATAMSEVEAAIADPGRNCGHRPALSRRSNGGGWPVQAITLNEPKMIGDSSTSLRMTKQLCEEKTPLNVRALSFLSMITRKLIVDR